MKKKEETKEEIVEELEESPEEEEEEEEDLEEIVEEETETKLLDEDKFIERGPVMLADSPTLERIARSQAVDNLELTVSTAPIKKEEDFDYEEFNTGYQEKEEDYSNLSQDYALEVKNTRDETRGVLDNEKDMGLVKKPSFEGKRKMDYEVKENDDFDPSKRIEKRKDLDYR